MHGRRHRGGLFGHCRQWLGSAHTRPATQHSIPALRDPATLPENRPRPAWTRDAVSHHHLLKQSAGCPAKTPHRIPTTDGLADHGKDGPHCGNTITVTIASYEIRSNLNGVYTNLLILIMKHFVLDARVIHIEKCKFIRREHLAQRLSTKRPHANTS